MTPFQSRRARLASNSAAAALLSLFTLASVAAAPPLTTSAARIQHVFVIVLENKNYENTFGTSRQDPYLRHTLVPAGALLTQYYGTGHYSLDNYISLMSGQAPTADTEEDCAPEIDGHDSYIDVEPTGLTADGQVVAQRGCIYPASVRSLPDQLEAAHRSWRGYMQDMGNDPARERATCGHPPLGRGTDLTTAAEAPSHAVPQGDAYATRHDPFMYFHSIIDSPACDTHVVRLEHLSQDLQRIETTPHFAFITPNLCEDGHDGSGTGAKGTTCVNGKPGGLTSADRFLKTWVPRILASPAYRRDGLLIITFDEGDSVVHRSVDAGSGQAHVEVVYPGRRCCGQQPGPNIAADRPGRQRIVEKPTETVDVVFQDYGGDRIGAVLLSPFIKPGSRSDVPYNHYSLLRSIEDIFQLPEHLGYAADNPDHDYRLHSIGEDRAIFKAP